MLQMFGVTGGVVKAELESFSATLMHLFRSLKIE
jgi:hypothetical protein